ncbi:MAG: DinB family protein [Armatimonadota bacterium]
MDIKGALKGQLHASLAMMRSAIEICPEAIWNSGEQPRTFWRMAYHTLYYSHMYLLQTREEFKPWEKYRDDYENIFEDATEVTPPSKDEMLEFVAFVDSLVDHQIETLDLDSQESGFSWYTMPKLDHMLVNLRHIQEHTGQLRDRLFEAGFDLRWIGKA